jgi:hypothetical protein
MAGVVLAIGAAFYWTAEKIHGQKKKKRALKAQEDSQQNVDDLQENVEILPAYHKDAPPEYDMMDQRTKLKVGNTPHGSDHVLGLT